VVAKVTEAGIEVTMVAWMGTMVVGIVGGEVIAEVGMAGIGTVDLLPCNDLVSESQQGRVWCSG